MKSELIIWLAGLSENAPELVEINAIRTRNYDTPESNGQCLTISQAAKKTGVSRPLLYRAMAKGALSAFFPYKGARPRITERELERWTSTRGQRPRVEHV